MASDFTITLERVFQGPMDLLLHLVREQEVEIHEVELSKVISAYLAYLEALRELDIELAGDFLVMASTLMSIKSRSLLPREEVEIEDELDPQDELIQRLLEYRRFKGAADDLEGRFARRSNERPRGYKGEARENEPEKTLDLGDLTAFDLLATFSRLMRETLADRPHQVRGDARPLRWFVKSVGTAVQECSEIRLEDLVERCVGPSARETLIGVFCALLELMKLGVVAAHGGSDASEVVLKRVEGVSDEDLEDLIGHTQLLDEVETEREQEAGEPEGADPPV